MKNLDFGCGVFLMAILTGACILAIWNDKLVICWCSNTVIWAYLMWQMFRFLCDKIDCLQETVNESLYKRKDVEPIKEEKDEKK